ncbi:hypothetical protein LJ656_31535 [Paraburkholderia sp. MMS20-SJTR3]|uniref:Uncharacterized protein n=1 Tax=Paraburkholderia sejongensis TaxID=2886946 RepID=A0ABS8K4K6_9BURK|nr:hypothetical protein [Paraburkholderia sp. MMS20-SJTR3]MCC8397109.1 hypothetical protein [Paraburkholderia sp. MMS20-SJTR3]
MTQNSALKPGHVSVTAVLRVLLWVLPCLDTPRKPACTAYRRRGAHHMKRAAQKQNACISDN